MARSANADAANTGSSGLKHGGAIAVVALQTVMLFMLSTLPTPLYRDYAHSFHFTVATLTLIYATYVAGTLFALFVFGRLSDQIGRATVSVPAILCAAVAAVLFILANGVPMLFAARLVTGLAAGLSSGTAVAWLRELQEGTPKRTITMRIVAANILGLGFGPLLCGLISALAPRPMIAPYVVYLVFLIPLAIAVLGTRETVGHRKSLDEVSLSPRVGVPRELREAFMAPGVITFVIFSLVGFYSAIAPSLLTDTLRVSSKAISGSIVFELFLAGAATVYVTGRISSRGAMLGGAAFIFPALCCLAAAQLLKSLPLLLAGTALGGIALGMAYRGTLEVANQLAPGDRRAELISALFVCGNLGLAVPVIGIGIVSGFLGPAMANLAFAGVVALLAIAGLCFGLARRRSG